MKNVTTLVLLLAIANVVVASISGFGVRMEWWGYPTGFSILKIAFYCGLAVGVGALVMLAIGFLKNLPIKVMAVAAFALAGLTAAGPLLTAKSFREIPTYGNIATNLENSPEFVFLAEERAATAENPALFTTAEAADLQRKYFPELGSIISNRSAAELAQATRQLFSNKGWELAPTDNGAERVEATATSFWFGFKDDVVVVLQSLPDGSTLIDARSASRVGKFDGGANVKRVQKILSILGEE